jgi:hypothetical protein
MKLTAYTRRLEECRKRWHRRTAHYVVEVARIVRGARMAAKDERRWGRWIREEIHMNRTTVYRYLQIADFLKAFDALKHQLVSISITKLYALSRLPKDQVRRLIGSGKVRSLSDVRFVNVVRHLQPKRALRITRPNLHKSLEASISRLDRSMKRWQHSDLVMPASVRMKLRSRLHAMEQLLDQIRTTSAAAM